MMPRPTLHLLCLGTLAALLAAGRPSEPMTTRPGTPLPTSGRVAPESCDSIDVWADQSLSTRRIELLELAFSAASAIPLKPHIKDRSRMQAQVVEACLTLQQPARALQWADQIADWRRGSALADHAMYGVKRDPSVDVDTTLARAVAVAETVEDWKRDLVRVKIAQVQAWRGNEELAAQLEANVVDSERGKIDLVRAQRLPDDAFDSQIERLEATLASKNFDLIRNALDAAVQLYARYQGQPDRRARIEQLLARSLDLMPIVIRIDVRARMAEASLDRQDAEAALAHLGHAQQWLDSTKWAPEDQITLTARLAALRHKSGDTATASTSCGDAMSIYIEQRASIVSVFRAATLRAVAEAYMAMGDRASAARVYRLAVDEGAANKNARPRAEDLCATCCSMALHAFEPDAELMQRLADIRNGLDHPW